MTAILRIANYNQSSTYDLLAGTLALLDNTHNTRLAGDGTVVESMVVGGAATDANIEVAVNTIDEFAEEARLFFENKQTYKSVWYEAGYDGEPSKRALVYGIELKPLHPDKFHGQMLGGGIAVYELAITRSARWEATAVSTAVTGTSISTLGGEVDLAAIDGDLPGRIEKLTFSGSADDSGPIDRIWAGIRPIGPGKSAFNPLWEAESGTLGATASLATDADASGGASNNCVSIAPDGTVRDVFRESVGQALGGNYNHMIGRYLVLLRYKLSAAENVFIYGRDGYLDTLADMSRPKLVTATAWRFLELGEVSIPPFALRDAAFTTLGTNAVYQFVMNVLAYKDAEAGAVTLYADCLVFIPSTHYTYSENSAVEEVDYTGVYTSSIHFTFEDGKQMAIYRDENSIPTSNLVPEFRNWHYPIEGGTLVIAGERTGVQDKRDTMDVSLVFKRRYRNISENYPPT